MAAELKPRDRLLRHGAESLSEAELLAVVLRNGRPGASALEVAESILQRAGGLVNLARADRLTLQSCGASDGRAAILLATLELIRRLTRSQIARRKLLGRPEKIAAYLALRFASEDQEIMGALYLDIRNRLIGEREIFRGCLTHTSVEPRPILQWALHHRAASFVLWHSHPSGDPSPSDEGLSLPRRMAEAGELLGVHLLAHIILGTHGQWISLSRHRAM